MIDHTRLLVRNILQNAVHIEWTQQGLGMLRTYLSPNTRIHLWSFDAELPGVTKYHTHPWHFISTVVAGTVIDHIAEEFDEQYFVDQTYKKFMKQDVRCGIGGDVLNEPTPVNLVEWTPVAYRAGDYYAHDNTDIHYTEYKNGTVTICTRKFLKDQDRDSAFVYMPVGEKFGSAHPKIASNQMVKHVAGQALRLMEEEDESEL